MSKLGTLIAIPIALLGVKRLQELFPDDPNPTPLIPTTPKEIPFSPDLIFREKQVVTPPVAPLIPTTTPTPTLLSFNEWQKKFNGSYLDYEDYRKGV